jgi:hypothetical protein
MFLCFKQRPGFQNGRQTQVQRLSKLLHMPRGKCSCTAAGADSCPGESVPQCSRCGVPLHVAEHTLVIAAYLVRDIPDGLYGCDTHTVALVGSEGQQCCNKLLAGGT